MVLEELVPNNFHLWAHVETGAAPAAFTSAFRHSGSHQKSAVVWQ